MATICDVAKKAGVSRSTASRVLQDKGYASAKARAAVRRAAKDLGYMPDVTARNLRLRRSQTVGILVWDISNPVGGIAARGVFDACKNEGYHITFGNTYGVAEEAVALLETFRHNRLAGIIAVAPIQAESKLKAVLAAIVSDGIPLVLVDRAAEWLEVDRVVSDWVKGGELAVEHLVSLGHERIAMIAGPRGISSLDDRVEGYLRTMGKHGLAVFDQYLMRCDFSKAGGKMVMERLLDSPPVPTAVFVANDLMAVGAIEACHDRGVKIPKDLSIVGHDDTPYATIVRPELTTVSAPYYDVAYWCGTRLIARIRGEQGPRLTITLEPKLVVRESTATPKEVTETVKRRAGTVREETSTFVQSALRGTV